MKKILSTLLIFVLVASINITSFGMNKNDSMEDFQQLVNKYHLIIDDNSNSISTTNLLKNRRLLTSKPKTGKLHFDSLNSLENFVIELQKNEQTTERTHIIEVERPKNTSNYAVRSSRIFTDERKYSEWVPYGNGTLWAVHEIYTTHKWKHGEETPVFAEDIEESDVDSDFTGFNIMFSYTHKKSTASMISDNEAKTTARGRCVFGVSVDVAGTTIEIGIPYNRTITDRFKLVYEE